MNAISEVPKACFSSAAFGASSAAWRLAAASGRASLAVGLAARGRVFERHDPVLLGLCLVERLPQRRLLSLQSRDHRRLLHDLGQVQHKPGHSICKSLLGSNLWGHLFRQDLTPVSHGRPRLRHCC